MGFNFHTPLLYIINQLLVAVSLNIFLLYSSYNFNWLDIYSRVLGNEFYINLYYFLWTSFWYIPLFILLIIIWQWTNYTNLKQVVITFVILTIMYNILLDIHFYWVLNTTSYCTPLRSEHYNNLLLNSINKYHPGFLYWSSLLIIVYWLTFNLSYVNYTYRFYIIQTEMFIVKKFIWAGLVLLVTLGLGGWWALQEGSWGGWWNWDPSEVFGLIILLFYLMYTHHVSYKQNSLQKWFYNLSFILIILQVYFFTQLNFDLVSHNFGTKIDNFIDNTNLYTIIIIISYFSLTYILYWKLYISNFLLNGAQRIDIKSIRQFKLYTYILLGLFFYETVYSLIPLFNDFLWKLLRINIVNHILIFEKYNLQIVYLIIVFFWKHHQLLILYSIYVVWSYWAVIFMYVTFTKRVTFFIHWFISLFMWLSLLTLSYIFTEWNFSSTPNLDTSMVCITSLKQVLLNVNHLSLDYTQVSYIGGEFLTSWNTIWIDTTPEVYSFLYYLTKDISNQLMIIGSKLFTFSVGMSDILSLNILVVLTLLINLYLFHFSTPKRIIF